MLRLSIRAIRPNSFHPISGKRYGKCVLILFHWDATLVIHRSQKIGLSGFWIPKWLNFQDVTHVSGVCIVTSDCRDYVGPVVILDKISQEMWQCVNQHDTKKQPMSLSSGSSCSWSSEAAWIWHSAYTCPQIAQWSNATVVAVHKPPFQYLYVYTTYARICAATAVTTPSPSPQVRYPQ